ncbi:MAG TPA: NAD-dependent epimerase/dehydratase family protein [Bacteroidales bacterium]|nr:NAD-dependent epimerase/dehydratase family protein [Bacteroidales bacterium]HOX73826.1 NAD-dependent epimerase/dehydratase family protein [Bacteroidales bacterium]HPM88249.1 NAD-dependent epimerase/dehydratase family protein [Bacteroidales bacterium]HQM68388.1 NAD-dependent epimerase/dehydratase family protein [Bacteroidales bacterium]
MKLNTEIIKDEEQLDEMISRPGAKVIEMFSRIDGDLIFLGVSGKTGPYLARMAKRACDEAGISKRIIGVARFETPGQKESIEKHGIESIAGNLLDRDFLTSLPTVKNVFFLAGMKFGAVDNLPLTWAVNSYLPAMVAGHYRDSRIVAFSTGCVYPLVRTDSGGSKESDPPVAIGEYAQSCLGRERMFEYVSNKYKTPVTLIRLNYSVEMRYGVLVDIASKVMTGQPVDLAMGYFNVIWQGDMNDFVLRSLEFAQSPARILNITGPETLSVRDVANEFGRLSGNKPVFINNEAETALLSNSSEALRLFGQPGVHPSTIIRWIYEWLKSGKRLLGKPTHFEVRDGKY